MRPDLKGPKTHMAQTKEALVVSYAEVAKDPRVRNQLVWLMQAGYIVNVLGRGSTPSGINGQYWEIRRWWLPLRLFAYLFLPNTTRYKFLMEFWLRRDFFGKAHGEKFDLIVLNTLDYLPLITRGRESVTDAQGKIFLDLHEYYPSQGVGLVWKLMFARYQKWLMQMIPSNKVDIRVAAAPGVTGLYAQYFDMPKPGVIYNVPPYENLQPKPVNPEHIQLVHHGKVDSARGLPLLIDAMSKTDERFSLTFMLVGSQGEISTLKLQADRLGLKNRVKFREPVAMEAVASALNQYDAEIIFFRPTTINYKHTLPNKYFEAVQARLGIVSGQSEEIVAISAPYGNCVVADGWNSDSLALAINKLDAKQLDKMKKGSHKAANDLSLEAEGKKFIQIIEA